MVNIIHTGDNVEKANKILKVAQKRFGLYGLEKTSMKEIASDIGISKATLYYYFPDKEHLFKAVVEMEQESFSEIIETTFETSDDPAILMRKFVKIRLDYFKTFFNLSRLRFEDFKTMKPILNDTYEIFNKKEIDQIKKILNIGIEKKIFFIDDVQSIATLFLESLKGIRSLVIHNKELLYVEQEDYDLLEKKQNAFTDVFIRGLMFKA
jgi:AcrR family transcriptional regulator